MSRRPSPFTEADVKRAIRAMEAAGYKFAGVRVEKDGAIVYVAREKAGEVDGKREWSF